jgi:hypothetical protein
MFLEYIKLLGTGAQPEFSFDYLFPMALILLTVVAIVFIGYKIKEELGAIIALLICGLIFLYMNDLLGVFF